ncbi:MAG: molybdopterin-binding protein [Candidatus Heimdallarchaeota archaeon]
MTIVELICFGNELLIGKTVNTNANWLGRRLMMLGATLTRITSVSDTIQDMSQVVQEALSRKPDIIITTGGMGTTFDDMALAAVAKSVDKPLVLSDEAIELIKERLVILKETRGIDLAMSEERKRMAMIPEGGEVLRNRAGSAPGVLFTSGKTKIFIVPGVPREMEAIFDHEIVKYFDIDPNHKFFEKSIIVNHIPESELAKAITDVRLRYPKIYFKTHPRSSSTGPNRMIEVEVHLTCICSDKDGENINVAEKEVVDVIMNMEGANGKTPKIKEQEEVE